MQSYNDQQSRGGPLHAAPSRGWLGRSIFAAAVLGASLGVSACGAATAVSPTILNTEKVERAIEHSALTERRVRANVSCPSGVHQKQGLVFSCTAVVGRTTTQFVVTEINGTGNVDYVAR